MLLVIDNNTRLMKHIRKMLRHYKCQYMIKKINEVNWSHINKADAVLMTGGPSIADTSKQILMKQKKIIKKLSKPFFGICLGLQLVCYTYNSEIIKLPSPRKGLIRIRTIKQNGILKGIKSLRVYENHKHCVKSVSKAIEVLAESKDGIEAIKVRQKPVYAVEFHPEIMKNNQGYRCFENFLKLMV